MCAQARHATYGILAKVSGPLVNADPITAHTELNNAEQISGCVAYIKRGGAPFTKKARVAVAAGACACVVANHDKETFGMSYTDDGLPFEALNIPCVMISVDIAEKLESSSDWQGVSLFSLSLSLSLSLSIYLSLSLSLSLSCLSLSPLSLSPLFHSLSLPLHLSLSHTLSHTHTNTLDFAEKLKNSSDWRGTYHILLRGLATITYCYEALRLYYTYIHIYIYILRGGRATG